MHICMVVLHPTTGVGVEVRLVADLIESTFDYSSVAAAMKEDLWQRYLHILVYTILFLQHDLQTLTNSRNRWYKLAVLMLLC